MEWLTLFMVALVLGAAGLSIWHYRDGRAEAAAWNDLLAQAGPVGPRFDVAAIAALPEPARRYFLYTIAPGTPLVAVAEIDMTGQLALGNREAPGYRPMAARQLLAPPLGLIWRLRAGGISGSDAATPATSWTRFWLWRLFPVVRVSGNPDHHRSAFGRVVAEGAFWVPSSLLPGRNVSWESIDENTARATVSCGKHTQSVDLTMDPDGQPERVMIRRWSNENPDKVFREQAFGGYLCDFREIGGYRLPMHVEGGNLIGTEEYFPFYIADVQGIRFPQLDARPEANDAARS